MIKIATFNVNSVRSRYDALQIWLKESEPDIALLQELKCQDEEFAKLDFKTLGYHSLSHGQKAYNGVAILSKTPLKEIARDLGDNDPQARFLAAETAGIKVASLYCPNGNPVDSDKFTYKLDWMAKLENYIKQNILPDETPWVLGGDYNICPDDKAVWDKRAMEGDALCRSESVACYRRLLNLGLTDAWRNLHPQDIGYSFWDYQGGAYAKNHGLLIDFLLLAPEAADRLQAADIESKPRAREKPSDHTPVVCELSL